MKCPYCGKEMISGSVVASGNRISWLPGERFKLENYADAVTIASNVGRVKHFCDHFRSAYLSGQYCAACKKVIVDVTM